MNTQNWLSRLLRRKPDQQRTTHATQSSLSVPLPQSTDERDQDSTMGVSEQRVEQELHASPVGTPPASQGIRAAAWHIGDTLLDQYEVMGTLGEGGMGTVYKVHHRGWNIDLAVKSPKPALFARAGGKENFVREAETWVNLQLHPHIVSCYYVRIIDEIPRIFAEYVDGGSLADWIGSRRLYEGEQQQALERMLDVAIQFAWGLHAAHEQGLVHQDIKPANVMMTPDGVVKVTDFGLAKARAMASEQGSEEDNGLRSMLVSSRGMTPAYCSPEQAAGQALSRKTDMWSWGVSLLEMWVGEVTWRSGVLAREVLSSYEPQDTAIPPIPAEFVKLLARCFESRPEARPATMLEVASILQEIYAREIGQVYPREAPQAASMQADTLNNRALSLYDLGKVEQAMQVWEQALHVHPQHLETTYNRGIALWRQGAMADETLIHQMEMAQATHHSHGQASYLLAQVHLEQGKVYKALSLLEEASSLVDREGEVLKLYKLAQEEVTTNNLDSLLFQADQEHSSFRVGRVSLSADGRILASSIQNRDIILLWEKGSTGYSLRTFTFQGNHDWPGEHVSLSADGSFLAAGGSDQAVRLWEVSTGRCLHILQGYTMQGHTKAISSVCLSGDGSFLASSSWDETVRLWEVSTGRCLHILRGHTNGATSVSLSADGRWLASGEGRKDGTIRLWEVSTGYCLHIFQGHTGGVTSVSLSTDGRWLASGSEDTTIRLWEVSTGRCLRILRGHIGRVTSVSLSADGNWLASGGADKTIRLWEVSSGRCLCTFQQGSSTDSVSLSADGRWLASGEGGTRNVYLWRCHDSGFRGAFSPSRIHSYATVTQTEQHAMSLIKQAEQAYRENHFAGALGLLHRLRTLPGGERHPQSLEVWNKLSLVCSRRNFRTSWSDRVIAESEEAIYSVYLSADGRWLASGGGDKTVRVWEVSSGRCLHILQGHTKAISSVCLSGDGSFLASSSWDKTVRVWEVGTGRCLHTFSGYPDAVESVSLSADGRWFASAVRDDKICRVWEVNTRHCLGIFQGHTAKVGVVSLSVDGRWLASGSLGFDRTVRLWEVSTGRCVHILQGHTNWVSSVSFSADGRWLASGSLDRTVRLWEISTGRCVHILQGHTDCIDAVNLSADGRWLISGSRDTTVRLWEVSTGRCLHILRGHTSQVESVSLSTDGRWLASGSSDGTIHLWELDWELEAHDPADWDEGARPYLESFLTLHMPYVTELPPDRRSIAPDIQPALTRQGKPIWNEEDFQRLIRQLQYVGYGWLQPEGVRRQLGRMVRELQEPSILSNEEDKDNDA
ncbi:protein kinase domain-containing protein [Ktedonobacter racemifer]|uniref:Serine/threonine protein kinase with WD40 repeats n=1 Tax=Ktedonobacter racemifer DSM 44963 TaxID=485913 RepID=D6U883_KTERA|nr:protein kinase [Ktedonobacter racemifer]EFH80094.1 serine/threonine protein kinase with WD40 repeats [Ktedonobacter racemifer DSM 44963]